MFDPTRESLKSDTVTARDGASVGDAHSAARLHDVESCKVGQFECSADDCTSSTSGDYCTLHQAPFIDEPEMHEKDEGDDEPGCYCGNGCEK